MKNIFNALALFFMLPAPLSSTATLQEPALTAGDGPLNPLCFSTAQQEGAIIDPLRCINDHIVAVEDDSAYLPAAGFHGQAYRFKGVQETPQTPYIQYRHLGQTNGYEAVWVEENSGGSGIFSSIYRLSRTADNKLRVEAIIAGGDRCNGGIKDAYVDGAGTLHYSTNLTLRGLYALGYPERAAQSTALDNGAANCVGTAHYIGNSLSRVTLAEDHGTPQPDKGDNTSITQCFNRLLSLSSGDVTLHPAQVQQVAAGFRQLCKPD